MDNSEAMELGLTAKLEKDFSDGMKQINTLYCREDLERAMNAVRRAKPDRYKFAYEDLKRICLPFGIDADKALKNRELVNLLPDRASLLERIYKLVHNMYHEAPSPETAMERIVRNLATEYVNDSVRLAILKKMTVSVGFKCKTINISGIKEWAEHQMPAESLKKYRDESSDQEKLKIIADNLNESIFDVHKQTELSIDKQLKLLVQKADSMIRENDIFDAEKNKCEINDIELSHDTVNQIKEYCKKKNIRYSEDWRILDILNAVCAAAKSDLDDFSECFNLLNNEAVAWMKSLYYRQGDGYKKLYELYKYTLRDARRDESKKWTPVKLADDFANGVFPTNNRLTREYLYWFAIIFGMTAVLKQEDEFDAKTDIVKNLFEDYYCDNLMRFFSKRYEDTAKKSEFEREPTGEGINYKNYVEVIYLYYLNKQDSSLTAGLRIDEAKKMIAECEEYDENVRKYIELKKFVDSSADQTDKSYTKAQKKLEAFNSAKLSKYKESAEDNILYSDKLLSDTEYYREEYIPELLDLSENDLPEYIYEHFLISPQHVKTSQGSKLMVSSSEHTAYEILTESVQNTKKEEDYYDVLFSDQDKDAERDEASIAANMLFLHDFADQLTKHYSADKHFVELIDQIRQRIGTDLDVTAGTGTKIMAAILHALYHSDGVPLSNEDIKVKIRKDVGDVSGLSINRCIRTLQELGFTIIKEYVVVKKNLKNSVNNGDKPSKDAAKKSDENQEEKESDDSKLRLVNVYRLQEEVSEDSRIKGIVKCIKKTRLWNLEEAAALLSDLILLQNNISGKPTRNTMVTALAVEYVTTLDYERDPSLPKIFRHFSAKANQALSQSRFQPISVKNIFDIFIICAIFAQIIDTNR